MANNDDLDDFFKKKDRKGNKQKKQTGLLTNNEELLKQLVIVTSATSAFKENMDFDDDDDEDMTSNNKNRHQFNFESSGTIGPHDDSHPVVTKSQPHSTLVNNKSSKNTSQLPVHENQPEQSTGAGQQDEWEDFEDAEMKYNQLRLKLARANFEGDDDEQDGYDDSHRSVNPENIAGGGEDINQLDGDDEQSTGVNGRREQLKEKPAWKLEQVKRPEPMATDLPVEKVKEPVVIVPDSKPAATSSSAYVPPQRRGVSSVTVVSGGGGGQRKTKKEKPNLESTEDFPTLRAAATKK